MSSLAFLVNEEAHKIEDIIRRENQLARTLIVVTIVSATFVVAFSEWVIKKTTGNIGLSAFISEAGSICLYFLAPIWFMLWRQKEEEALKIALLFYSFNLVIMALVDYLTKGGLRQELHLSPQVNNPKLLFGLLMLLPWVPLITLSLRNPSGAQRIGLGTANWKENVFVGILAGAFLGAHMLLVVTAMGRKLIFNPWPYSLWLLGYELGIQSLGEELFFRGFLFNYWYNYRGKGFWAAAFLTGVFNVLVYMVKALWISFAPLTLGAQFYIMTMAIVNAALFRWRGSILSCWISNAIFSLAASLVVS